MIRLMFALLMVLAFGDVARAGESICAPYSKPIRLNFETVRVDPTYNNSLNVTGVRRLFNRRGHVLAGDGHQQALGVTFVETRFSLAGSTEGQRRGSGYCVYLETVQAEFGWNKMEVFVASEYPPGSCEYNAVLDHENQHVSINNTVLRELAPRIRAELEALLSQERAVFTSNPRAAGDQALRALHAKMDSILDAYEAELRRRNAVIDTAKNYAAINDLCRDWDRGIVWPKVR